MNEVHYFHAVAVAAHGEYHALKKFRANADSWSEAYERLPAPGMPDLSLLERHGIRIVLRESDEYPDALRHIAQPPFGLYVRGGALPGAMNDTIAIVGTRRASTDGREVARTFAGALADAGFSVASGLAFGIDAAAHEGCLDADGTTVAILAGGIDAIYPRAHELLAHRILGAGGTIASEYPPGEGAFGYRFIERNRIVSGLACGTVVIEAPVTSGAMATAHYAVEQGRDVFVVPGPVLGGSFAGSHQLIRQGAELITRPEDILTSYDRATPAQKEISPDGRNNEETLILKALKEIGGPADVDKLSSMTKLEPRIVSQAVSFLIIRGSIRETGTGYTI